MAPTKTDKKTKSNPGSAKQSRPDNSKPEKFAGFLKTTGMLLSLLLIIMGFNMYVGAAAFKATAKTAQGEVLANRLYSNEEILPIRIRKTQAQSAETKRISGYQATVRFAIEGGEPVETMIPSGQEISPGDRLEVLYDPDKPTLALFKKDFSPWKEGALPLIPAVLVYGASLWGASLIRRKYKGK